MIKFSYTRDGVVIIHSTDSVYLPDVMTQFQNFLKGIGYVIDGDLQVIEQSDNDERLFDE